MFKRAHTLTRFKSIQPSCSGARYVRARSLGKAAIALATLVVPFTSVQPAFAQKPASAPASGHSIAVIDVAYIFKNLPAIKAEVGKIESDLKKFDAEIKQRREDLKQATAQLQTLKSGTPDYARQEELVADMQSKLRLHAARKQQELRDAEAKIYFDNYQRLSAAVKAIANHNNIQLVLRFNSEEMSLEESDSVARGVTKQVVYHNSTIDMTKTVMQYLEQQSGSNKVATGNRVAR